MTDIETLYATAREVTTDLLPRLAALIPDKGTPLESQIGSHGKALAAPLPWNEPVAMLYYEIHGDARKLESALTLRLFGHITYRPGADHHTTDCINRLPVLIAHARDKDIDPADVEQIARTVAGWPARIRRQMDEALPGEEQWARAPGGLKCPYCDKALQVPPGWKHATDIVLTCRRCKDADGNHHSWAPDLWLGQLEDDPDLITEREAVETFGLGSSTLRSWVSRDQLAHAGKRRGHRVYNRHDVAALVNASSATRHAV